MSKIPVSILGATGMAGQRYIELLQDHPFFEVRSVVASVQSASKTYKDALKSRWLSARPIPEPVKNLVLGDPNDLEKSFDESALIFSAVDSKVAREMEPELCKMGKLVVSNASAFRNDPLVPVVIPEINPSHLELIEAQKAEYGYRGFMVTKPNCSIQSYLMPIFAFNEAGFKVDKVYVSTMQALSGAGFPGVSSMNAMENVIPFISGEEEKSEKEPLKILSSISQGKLCMDSNLKITAHCNRVPVLDGHLACVSVGFENKAPSPEQAMEVLEGFQAKTAKLKLPLAPVKTICVYEEPDRPQPRLDRDHERGMSIHVGRVRPCNLLDLRFVGLSHNTLRGAAGGGVLIAELLYKKGYLNRG